MSRDDAVTAVLGAVLMLALMMTLVPSAMIMRQAMSDAMEAERIASEQAAFCARNPSSPACDKYGPLPGYRCAETQAGIFVCASDGVVLQPGMIEVPPELLSSAAAAVESPAASTPATPGIVLPTTVTPGLELPPQAIPTVATPAPATPSTAVNLPSL